MALDDLSFEHTSGHQHSDPPAAGPSAARWVAVALGGLVAGGLLTFWWLSRTQPGTATPAPTAVTDVAVGSNRPKRQPIDLPSLEMSDLLLRQLVTALSAHPTLARFLATPSLVRGATLAVVQIGDGRTPAEPLGSLRPSSRLLIAGSAGHINPDSYKRWDTITAALTSISAADAAQLYVNVKPLFDQAYIELGHPGGDFDTALVRAMQMLADAPETPATVQIIRRTNYLEHEDLTLRALPPVQKQFLLIGPDNQRQVIGWLRQFAATLDLTLE